MCCNYVEDAATPICHRPLRNSLQSNFQSCVAKCNLGKILM